MLDIIPDIDECLEDTHKCDVNSTCTNVNGSYTCSCIVGLFWDGNDCLPITSMYKIICLPNSVN